MVDERKYRVRQYRPAYFSGFDDFVCLDVSESSIIHQEFMKNFQHGDFDHFSVEPYYGTEELIIEAHYKSGKHWVVGFAVEEGTQTARGWRYDPAPVEDDRGR
jgi:hypothetical protein